MFDLSKRALIPAKIPICPETMEQFETYGPQLEYEVTATPLFTNRLSYTMPPLMAVPEWLKKVQPLNVELVTVGR